MLSSNICFITSIPYLVAVMVIALIDDIIDETAAKADIFSPRLYTYMYELLNRFAIMYTRTQNAITRASYE